MQSLTPAEAHVLLGLHQATLVDVREMSEYQCEHVPFALSLPMSQMELWMPWLCSLSPQVWIICCLKGKRSSEVARVLLDKITAHPDRRIFVMTGGLQAWSSEGFVTLKDGVRCEHGNGLQRVWLSQGCGWLMLSVLFLLLSIVMQQPLWLKAMMSGLGVVSFIYTYFFVAKKCV